MVKWLLLLVHLFSEVEAVGQQWEPCVLDCYIPGVSSCVWLWMCLPLCGFRVEVCDVCSSLNAFLSLSGLCHRACKCHVTAPQPAEQPAKLVLNKASATYKSMLGDCWSTEKRPRTCPIPTIFWNVTLWRSCHNRPDLSMKNKELRQARDFSPSMRLYGTLPLFRTNFRRCHALLSFVTSSLASPMSAANFGTIATFMCFDLVFFFTVLFQTNGFAWSGSSVSGEWTHDTSPSYR